MLSRRNDYYLGNLAHLYNNSAPLHKQMETWKSEIYDYYLGKMEENYYSHHRGENVNCQEKLKVGHTVTSKPENGRLRKIRAKCEVKYSLEFIIQGTQNKTGYAMGKNTSRYVLILKPQKLLKTSLDSQFYSLAETRLVKRVENIQHCDKFLNSILQYYITKILLDCDCSLWRSCNLDKTGKLNEKKKMEVTYSTPEEITATLLGYPEDDFREKPNTNWDVILNREPSIREAIGTLKSPQGSNILPGYKNEATHRNRVHNEGVVHAIVSKWIMEHPGENTAPETAVLLLRASVLPLSQIMQVYISIKGQADVDSSLEREAFQTIELWLRQNILDGGDSIGLLDLEALGDKRDRPLD